MYTFKKRHLKKSLKYLWEGASLCRLLQWTLIKRGRHSSPESNRRSGLEMEHGYRRPGFNQREGRPHQGSKVGEKKKIKKEGLRGGLCRTTRPDTGGKNISEVKGHTDVVTLSAALLTSFLLESRPLAAFRSLRRFSAAFFIVFSSPGWGVARRSRVPWETGDKKVYSIQTDWVQMHNFAADWI